jgi:hypothetical protein
MATNSITAMDAYMQVLLSRSHKWARGHDFTRDLPFVMFASSRLDKDGKPIYYKTRADGRPGCTCLGYLHRGVCSHSKAVCEQFKREQEEVAHRRAYRDLGLASPAEIDCHLAGVKADHDARAETARQVRRIWGE